MFKEDNSEQSIVFKVVLRNNVAGRKGLKRLVLILFQVSSSFAHPEVNSILEKYS